jgi:light-regulated signal transduction histidine kinase (bacteriophytochrome)
MKNPIVSRILSVVAVAATVAVLGTGCSSTGSSNYKQADKTGASIAKFRDEVVKGKNAVDATMTSLGNVAENADTDPRKSFEQFKKDVANLDSTANDIRKRATEMQAKGQAYFKQWEEELAKVTNPEIRKLAEDRRATLQETFATVRKYSEPLKAQFEPWMSDLKDLVTYLGNDLTVGGVDAAKSLFKKTTAEGLEVQKSMDGLVHELNTIAATITPAKVKPAEKK